MSAALDKDVLATLTDEEREAIEGDMTDIEKQALAENSGDDDDDGDDYVAGSPPVEGKGAADAVPAATDEVDDEPVETSFRPTYQAELPEDFDAQLSEVDTTLGDLERQFKEGEIEFDEFRASSRTLEAKRSDLQQSKIRADIYADMTAQNAQQEWVWTVNRFVSSTAKSAGVDYSTDDVKRADLDTFVKALGQKPENENRDYEWFLNEAHKRVMALHGMPVTGQQRPGKQPPSRKPPMDGVPVTLANVPGGDGPGDIAGEFADLDGLDGDALETAIERMSPAQREKYARGV